MTGDAWPYPDLVLRTPDCPLCGGRARLVVAPYLHPMAWCTDDECTAITWDPTITRADLLADAVTMPSWNIVDDDR